MVPVGISGLFVPENILGIHPPMRSHLTEGDFPSIKQADEEGTGNIQ